MARPEAIALATYVNQPFPWNLFNCLYNLSSSKGFATFEPLIEAIPSSITVGINNAVVNIPQ